LSIPGFLLGRREDLRSFGMNLDPIYSIISLLLFFTFNATSLLLLQLKISCSSVFLDDRVRAFLEVKGSLFLYSWALIALSWFFTVALFSRYVPKELNMRRRKYFYLISNCSIIYAIVGGINTIILAILPGRIISCEGTGWKDLISKFSAEMIDYLFSFPNFIFPILSLISIIWFSWILYRIHRISFGMNSYKSLLYSAGFTLIFILLSALLISASAIILLLL
jgi:hypothetical protein